MEKKLNSDDRLKNTYRGTQSVVIIKKSLDLHTKDVLKLPVINYKI